ncbi:MAG: hypothetical protein CXR31_15695 [Geobacter sp.]|nr:MAG: hypothetical protein CXR31_15695 [Geobacter sp.]
MALVTSCAPPLRQAMVDTPNSCFRLERVEEDRVYLTSGGQRICLQVIGHVPVELDPSIRRVQLFTDGSFWMEQDVTAERLPAK